MTNCSICKNLSDSHTKTQFPVFKDFIKKVNENLVKYLEGLTKLCIEALINKICKGCMGLVKELDEAHKKCSEIEGVISSLHLKKTITINNRKDDSRNEVTIDKIASKKDVTDVEVDKNVFSEDISQAVTNEIQDISNKLNEDDSKSAHQKQVFPCSYCDKVFNLKGTLKRHKLLHTGELPYQCDLCGKRFTHLSSFKIHKLTHSGEKKYKCSICNKLLMSSSHLKRHMMGHTGEKNYQCDKCGKKFTQRYNLVAHEKIHN